MAFDESNGGGIVMPVSPMYGNVTSRAVVDVPKGCCFTVAVEYVNGTVDDPATTPTPLINVIDGSLSITRIA